MLVTKDEFMQVCWGNKGVIVSDNTVRQSLFRLRTSLAEVGAPEDTLITQGRNGYILKPGIIKLSDSENIYDIIANDSSDEETLSENNHPTITADLFKQDKNLNEEATDAIKQPAVKNKIMRYTLSGIAIFLSFAAGLYLRFIF